jgi:hypothetical protein
MYFSCFKTSFPALELERPFPVFERPFPFFKHPFPVFERLFSCFFKEGDFVPGRPLTKGHRDKKISLSRDKGTTGRPVPVCPVPWKRYSLLDNSSNLWNF